MNAHNHPVRRPSLVTADTSKVSPAEFMEQVLPGFAERRAEQRRLIRASCIRAIHRGDTYGFPPMMVEDCRRELAEQVSLIDEYPETITPQVFVGWNR